MEASVFVRQANSREYSGLGALTFSALPRVDEFISTKQEGNENFFQVIAVNHAADKNGAIEIYAIQTEPTWIIRKGRSIGFGPSG